MGFLVYDLECGDASRPLSAYLRERDHERERMREREGEKEMRESERKRE